MIDKIFDEAAIRRNAEEAAKAVETYNQAIENIKKNLKSLSVKIEINDPSQIIPQIEKLNATILSVSQSANEANKSLEKLTTSQLRAAKAATEEAKQQTEAAKQAKIRAQEQAILNKQNQQGQRITVTLSEALNNEAKTMAEAAAQNRVLRKAAKELDLTMEGAQDTLTQYNDKINKNTEFIRANSDAATKQKMNIGNYKSVLNGLNVSVSQIIREAPSAKYGLDIFFLAISNNVPMLFDSIKAMKAYNAEMVSLGKTSEKINIGKALLSSVFSWNTLLIAGLTVLTLYGEEIIDWVKGLFKGKEALDGTRKAQEALNDAWKDGTKNAQEELTRLRLLYKAATDDAASVDTRRIAREKILEMAEEYNLSISKEKNSIAGLSNIYQELTKAILASSIARAQENKVVKLSEEISDKLYEAGIQENIDYKSAQDLQSKLYVEAGFKGESPSREYTKEERKEMLKQINALIEILPLMERREDLINKISSYQIAFNASRGDGDKTKKDEKSYAKGTIGWWEKQISDLEEASKNVKDTPAWDDLQEAIQYAQEQIIKIKGEQTEYEKLLNEIISENRVESINETKERQIAEINKWYEEQLKQIKNVGGELESAEDEAAELLAEARDRKIEDVERKAEEKMRREAEKMARAANSVLKEMIKRIQTEGDTEQFEIEISLMADEQKITEEYNKGLLNSEQYEEKLLEITQRGARERIKAQIDALEEELRYIEQMRSQLEAEFSSVSDITQQQSIAIQLGEGEFSEENINNLTAAIRKLRGELGLLEAQQEKTNKDNYENGSIADRLGISKEKLKIAEASLQGLAQITDELNNLFNEMYDARISKIEEEADAVEEANQRELESLERMYEQGAISQEEYEARKRLQEELTEQKQEELEKKKAQLQIKQAKMQKAMDLTQAIINTALSITSALSTQPFVVGLIMAGVASALGAVQIATIAAQPIPTYAKGTDYHKGGMAIVGDAGKNEVVMTNKGAFITPNTPTLMDIPKGAKVFPDFELLSTDDLDFLKMPRKSGLLSLINDPETGEPIIINNDYSRLEKNTEDIQKAIDRQTAIYKKNMRRQSLEEYKKRRL